MADQFSYLSVLPFTRSTVDGAGSYGVIQFLNTEWMSGGTTVTTTGTTYATVSVNRSVGAISIVAGPNITITNVNSTISIRAAAQTSYARDQRWSALGVLISSASPSSGIYYSEWLAGSPGYWAWISVTS